MRGATSLSTSSILPPMENSPSVKPVMLPPGRVRLATNPLPTGSNTCVNTIGMLLVARFNGSSSSAPLVQITSGCRAMIRQPPVCSAPWPATAFDVALAFLSPVFLDLARRRSHGPMVYRLRLHLHPVDGSPARVQQGVWAERVPKKTCKISHSVSRRWHQRRACPNRRRQVAGEVGPAGHHREPQRRRRQHRCCAGGAGGARWLYAPGLGNAAARHE